MGQFALDSLAMLVLVVKLLVFSNSTDNILLRGGCDYNRWVVGKVPLLQCLALELGGVNMLHHI